MVRSALAVLMAISFPLLAQKAEAPKISAYDKPAMEKYVRHLMMWPSQVTISVADAKPSGVPGLKEVAVTGAVGARSQTVPFYVSDDGQKIMQGTVYTFAEHPFKSTIDKLKTEFQPAIGTAGAPVVLVVFSDFQCPHCKDEAKILRTNLIKAFPTEVRLYFKDFPIEGAHPWAKTASIAGRCVYRQNADAFWDFHDWAFENQDKITLETFGAKLNEFALSKKLDSLALKACVDSKATAEIVEKNMADGRDVGITSTPSIFINGRPFSGSVPWEQLQQLIQFEIDHQKVAKNAGDNCGCELKLPSLTGK